MIHFLYGPDDFSIKSRVKELTSTTFCVTLATNNELVSYMADGTQMGLFGTTNYIVVTDIFPALTEEWLASLTVPVIIIGTEKVDRRTALVKWLMKQQAEEYLPKDKGQTFAWMKEHYPVEPPVMQQLWDRHQSNLWYLSNELEKLQSYAGYNATITLDHSSMLSEKTVEENIFEFIDAFSTKSLKSLPLFMQLLHYKIDQGYIFSMITRQIRLLLLSNEPDGLKGQHPFVKQKLHAARKRWEDSQLKSAHTQLMHIDYRTKTGIASLEDELFLFIGTFIE